jgi:hypothetical protein
MYGAFGSDKETRIPTSPRFLDVYHGNQKAMKKDRRDLLGHRSQTHYSAAELSCLMGLSI